MYMIILALFSSCASCAGSYLAMQCGWGKLCMLLSGIGRGIGKGNK
jgi:hypothetical protein